MSHSHVRELWRRMSFSQSPVITVLAVVSTGLVALAAYFWSVVDKLHIPITPGLPVVATLLPAVNFIAVKYITGGGRRGQSRPSWSLQTGIISMLLVIIDTVLITQSINNMSKSTISCPLEKTWRGWYRAKDATSIRGVQDALNCCGLNTFKDQAWPFTNVKQNITADACSTTFGRGEAACFDPWSHMHQLSAGMFMTVAIVSLLSKGIIFLVYRLHNRNQGPSNRRLLADSTTSGTQNNGSGSYGSAVGPRIRPDERARPAGNDDDDVESLNENSRLLEDSSRPIHYDTSNPVESRVPVLTDVDGGVWDNETSRAHQQR